MIKLIDVYQGTGVTPGAIEFLYRLIEQRMTEPEVNISATMPTLEQHRQFVHRRPYRYWYLIEVTDSERRPSFTTGCDSKEETVRQAWVGYVSATDRNEIGIVLCKEHRRKGYGRAAVQEFMLLHEPMRAEPSVRRGRWIANVNPSNAASIALFTNLGGKHIQNTYEL